MYRSELLYDWAQKHISDQDVWPVFVPSYNRPNAVLLRRIFNEPEFPIVLCIREEEREKYKAYQDVAPIMYLHNVHDISETRECILENASKYYHNIFMFDDDIGRLDYMIPSKTKNGKDSMRPSRTCFGAMPRGIDILKMWMALLHEESKQIALSSIGFKSDNWNISLRDSLPKYNSGACIQCIHINTELVRGKGLHYRPLREAGAEDYSFQFDVMSSGLKTAVYTDLMYDCPAVNSIPGGCENMLGMDDNSRYAYMVDTAKKFYGDHPGIRYTRTRRTGLQTIKFNWKYWRNYEHSD